MDNEQNCDIGESEFDIQQRCYVHFLNNTLGKGINSNSL